MSYSHPEEEFLPLDSQIRPCSVPEYNNSYQKVADSLYDEENEVAFLMTKIAELEKKYVDLEKTYLRKIKELKEQLSQKHHVQGVLNQELVNLTRQYEEHKREIQKVSEEIKLALEENQQKRQKETKIKSVSPKNPPKNSPKRLIRKSLEIVKKEALQPKNQTSTKNDSNFQNNSIQIGQKNNKPSQNALLQSQPHKKNDTATQHSTKISNDNDSNVNKKQKVVRKPLYSPPSQTNGPSPKKNLLFNSSKQLNIFDKPVIDKKKAFLNNSPSRRLNMSPKQTTKQTTNPQKKQKVQTQSTNTDLPLVQQKNVQTTLVKQQQKPRLNKQNPVTRNFCFSPNQNKKASSPSNTGQLKNNVMNKNPQIQKDPKQKQKEAQQKLENKIHNNEKQDTKKPIISQALLTGRKEATLGTNLQTEKKPRSPQYTNRQTKSIVQSKFSPVSKKLPNFSPTQKTLQMIQQLKSNKGLGTTQQQK